MRWTNKDPFAGGGLDPPAGRTPTSENQRVHPICLDHGEFEITVIWRCGNPFPYRRLVHRFNPAAVLVRLETGRSATLNNDSVEAMRIAENRSTSLMQIKW
jgi:hypothetical protein